jgi:transketolase N-terminal domain/subunit
LPIRIFCHYARNNKNLGGPVTGLSIEDRRRLEDIGFMTCMTLVLLGNYAQTGHFGGPLAYTPFNVAAHLAGPEHGGMRYDYRRPKHPFGDKFMMAAGHSVPTCYALYMILGQALERKFKLSGDKRYYADPEVAILPIDALGFRRGAGALKTLLAEQGLADDPYSPRPRRAASRRCRVTPKASTSPMTVNGGPSGVGIATAAGKGGFWDMAGAVDTPKIIALEGEFAMTEGHAQELKTQALALKVGKRLRVILSDNNAGIDDVLLGGVIDRKFTGYNLVDQWTSYGWNVITIENGGDYGQVIGMLEAMEAIDPADKRPVIAIAKTTKGYWPAASNGQLTPTVKQIVSYQSHPYGYKMNSDYFVALGQHL